MSSPAVAAVEPLWLKQARGLVGLHEIVGSRHEPKVLEFFKEAGHPEIHNDETAWCAAFANAMLRRAGYAGTGALNARSFLSWGTGLSAPKPGCIVVFKRGNSGWEGHVAFFLRDLGDSIEVLGGNQGNAVSIARYSKAQLLGYRWPLISAAKPPVVINPTKTVVVQKPASKKGAAAGAVAGVGLTSAAAAAAQNGLSALEIVALIAGISAVAVAIGFIGYRIIKGHWLWTSISTGNQLPALSLPSPQPLDESLALASAQLALPSEELPVTPLLPLSTQTRPRKPSVRRSPKTRTPAKSSKTSKRSAAKKSSPKRRSKLSG